MHERVERTKGSCRKQWQWRDSPRNARLSERSPGTAITSSQCSRSPQRPWSLILPLAQKSIDVLFEFVLRVNVRSRHNTFFSTPTKRLGQDSFPNSVSPSHLKSSSTAAAPPSCLVKKIPSAVEITANMKKPSNHF